MALNQRLQDREDALFGIPELMADLAQAQVGVEQQPVGDFAASVIDECGVRGVLGSQSPLQSFECRPKWRAASSEVSLPEAAAVAG